MSESSNDEGLDLTQQPDDTLALAQAQPEAEPETALEPAPFSEPENFVYLIREKCGTEIKLVYRLGDSLSVGRQADNNIVTTNDSSDISKEVPRLHAGILCLHSGFNLFAFSATGINTDPPGADRKS